eukprot:TRINITY_DN57958_c0_g1_i1.p1 TRINITY_DN57958_c0_g1~~TRINITY_DN57958_c0_g1_i1.p1  ORF type:complete len:221 (-),score=47.11 TRINITY_DN57958_c0_g1_i1:19-660(-)
MVLQRGCKRALAEGFLQFPVDHEAAAVATPLGDDWFPHPRGWPPLRLAGLAEERWQALPSERDERQAEDAVPAPRVRIRVPPPEFLVEILGGGGGQSRLAEEHETHAVGQHHTAEDMADTGAVILSTGTTFFLATLTAIFAMRLIRELLRSPRQGDLVLNPELQGPGGSDAQVLQLDVPGLQPFRPYSGPGHRLKDDSQPSSGAAQEVSHEVD